jgi:hypothetical protein
MTQDQRTCAACFGTNGNHERGCYLAAPSSKQEVTWCTHTPSCADLEACRSWLVARGDSLARSGDMIRMVDELLERRAHETPAKPARDADHCDFPDCEQHNALVVENLRRTLASKQAKIDALMLEFCPGEMSAEQKAEWAKHQQRSPLEPPEHCSATTGEIGCVLKAGHPGPHQFRQRFSEKASPTSLSMCRECGTMQPEKASGDDGCICPRQDESGDIIYKHRACPIHGENGTTEHSK